MKNLISIFENNFQILELDMTQVENCESYLESQKPMVKNIQVVAAVSSQRHNFKSCRVERQRVGWHCGMYLYKDINVPNLFYKRSLILK